MPYLRPFGVRFRSKGTHPRPLHTLSIDNFRRHRPDPWFGPSPWLVGDVKARCVGTDSARRKRKVEERRNVKWIKLLVLKQLEILPATSAK